MNLNNQAELEAYFADNFDTVLFPILADMYLDGRDLVRARKSARLALVTILIMLMDGLYLQW